MSRWLPFKKNEPKKTSGSRREEEDVFHHTLEASRQDMALQIGRGVSRQTILKELQKKAGALEGKAETAEEKGQLRAYDLQVYDLHNELMRNLQMGRGLEMAGREDEAIQYYETAVADQMSTRFPYEHLRVIYLKRKQYDDTLRICQTALANPHLSEQDHAHFQTWADKLQPTGGAA